MEIDESKDYTKINNPLQIYDAYNFSLTDFQILAFESLHNYRNYKGECSTKMIQDVNLKFNFYNSVEPRHPVMPLYEIGMYLHNIKIITSDYLLHFLLRLQKSV